MFVDQCGPAADHVRRVDSCCGKKPFEALWLRNIVGVHSNQQIATCMFDQVVECEGQLRKSGTEQPYAGVGPKSTQLVEEFVAAGVCPNQKLEVGMALSKNALDCVTQVWICAIDAKDHA
jgi:hypothetical protein